MALNHALLRKVNSGLAIILIVLITCLTYANSLGNSFVWDDFWTVVNNDSIKSWKNFPLLFSGAYLKSFAEQTYRPVVTLSYFTDYSIWKLNPLGYHLTNVILHILNAVLIYFLINLIAADKNLALLVSLLFSLHPVNSEAVNVVSFREDLLVLLFFLAAVILYIKSRHYILCLILFILALFSKEMAVTLPAILVLYDYLFIFKGDIPAQIKKSGYRYLGFILVLIFYIWVEFFVMKNPLVRHVNYPGGNFYTNILTMSRVYAHYIYLVFLPVNAHLILHGNSFISYSFFTPKVFFSILLLIFCVFIANKIKRNSKEISFSIYWFLLTLIPVSNIVPLNNFLANRFLYVPIVGFCFFLGVFLFKLPGLKILSFTRESLLEFSRISIIVLLLFYPVFTAIRNFSYKNSVSLWSEMVDIYPESFEAHSYLAYGFLSSGRYDKAIKEYNTAISLTPPGIPTEDYEFMAVCYYHKGMPQEAIEALNKALQLNPRSEKAYLYLGTIFKDKGAYDKAINYFKEALRINPGSTEAHKELSSIYADMKRP